MRSALLLLALTVLGQTALALEIPELRERVVDRAEVLAPATRQRLEQQLAAYERDTGHQIVVHTTPSLEGLPIEDYSIQIAEAWKVGHKGLDNGVILTVAPEERRVRIEVGYGLEGVIPDAIASRIVEERMLPEFGEGRYDAGTLAGVDAILRAASGEKVEIPRAVRQPEPRTRGSRSSLLLWLFMLALFGWRGFFFLPFLGGPGTYRGGFGGGFGGGGGGFGGGGGGFGGGGASGGW